MQLDELTPIIVAVVGGTGLWGWLSIKSKQTHELKLKEKDTSGEFKENLVERIKAISNENRSLNDRVQDLQNKLMEVSIQLAASQEKIKHLENEIKTYELQSKLVK